MRQADILCRVVMPPLGGGLTSGSTRLLGSFPFIIEFSDDGRMLLARSGLSSALGLNLRGVFMPRRTRAHIVGDIAVSRVVSICTELGWACESIQKDYGEDLWLQTMIGEKIDYHRVWFQIKATENINKYKKRDSGFSYTVDIRHALRWVRNLELVVFILWDVKKDIGYWTIPKSNVTDWDLWISSGQTSKLLLNKENIFTPSSAERISWIARISYYNVLLAEAQQVLANDEWYKELGQPSSSDQSGRVNLICYDFLQAIEFFQENGSIGNHIGEQIVEEMEKALGLDPKSIDVQLCLRSVIIVLLRLVHGLSGSGLPSSLFRECTRFAADIILSRLKDRGITDLHQLLAKRPNNSF